MEEKLNSAAENGREEEVRKILKENNIKVNLKGPNGFTAFHIFPKTYKQKGHALLPFACESKKWNLSPVSVPKVSPQPVKSHL
jgi:hypothetical protein